MPQELVRDWEAALAKNLRPGFVSPLDSFGTASSAAERGLLSPDGVNPHDLGNRFIADVVDKYLQSSASDRVACYTRDLPHRPPCTD